MSEILCEWLNHEVKTSQTVSECHRPGRAGPSGHSGCKAARLVQPPPLLWPRPCQAPPIPLCHPAGSSLQAGAAVLASSWSVRAPGPSAVAALSVLSRAREIPGSPSTHLPSRVSACRACQHAHTWQLQPQSHRHSLTTVHSGPARANFILT